jgi:hypothetical protein
VPYHLTWELEQVEDHRMAILEVESLAAVPELVLNGL